MYNFYIAIVISNVYKYHNISNFVYVFFLII